MKEYYLFCSILYPQDLQQYQEHGEYSINTNNHSIQAGVEKVVKEKTLSSFSTLFKIKIIGKFYFFNFIFQK